jgi:predicted RNA-binding Zn-ribbon protein involved in translation (DUF1610 family)
MAIPAKAPMFSRKPWKRNYLPIGTIPSQLECPKCSSKLKLLGVVAAIPQMYLCEKCGYRGPVGLEPGKIRLGKKARI